MAEIEVVKKYMRILFGNASKQSSTSKKNIKILERFASLVEDEMPELYHKILSHILDYDILRYYDERQPVAVAIALINDRIEEFLYSEQENKIRVIMQTLSLIGGHKYQAPELLEHILSLYFSDSISKTGVKQNSAIDNKTKAKRKEKREIRASKLDRVNNMLHKIQLFKDQIEEGHISTEINVFWTEVEEYLKKEIEKYEKMKNKTNQYDKSTTRANYV